MTKHDKMSTTKTMMDIISHLLLDRTSTLHNLIIIASYRSNQVHSDHPLHNLIETVENAREYNHGTSSGIFKIVVHLFPLDSLAKFTADCLLKEASSSMEDVIPLVKAIYEKNNGHSIVCETLFGRSGT